MKEVSYETNKHLLVIGKYVLSLFLPSTQVNPSNINLFVSFWQINQYPSTSSFYQCESSRANNTIIINMIMNHNLMNNVSFTLVEGRCTEMLIYLPEPVKCLY